MLCEQGSVPGIEPLSFIEIGLALLPLTSPARDVRERLRNLATVRQKLTCLFKITHGCVIIFQTSIVIISFSQYGFAKIGLEGERCFRCLAGPSLGPLRGSFNT